MWRDVLFLLLLGVFAFGASCEPLPPVQIVFEQTHSPRWKIEPGEGYAPLRELLEGQGYGVTAWNTPKFGALNGCPDCVPPVEKEDVDVLFVAMPQVAFSSPIRIALVEQWVEAGGVLVIITDHKPFPQFVNALAGRFGAHVENIPPVIRLGSGTEHCPTTPPAGTECLFGVVSYPSQPGHSLIAPGEWVSTYAGSWISLDPTMPFNSLLRLDPTLVFIEQGTSNEIIGEDTMVWIPYGAGVVIVSAEAAAWSCNDGVGVEVGWCPTSWPGAEHNDVFITRLLRVLTDYYGSNAP